MNMRSISGRFHFRWAVVGVAATWPTLVWGSLSWSETRASLVAPVGAKEVTAQFHFKNTGTAPVTIVNVRANCDCLTTTLDRKQIAAGESGVLHVAFAPGNRTGIQQKLVAVTTDDPDVRLTQLYLQIDVPSPVSYSNEPLHWKVNGENVPRTMEITAVKPLRLTTLEIAGPTTGSTASIETVEPGVRYRLTLKPAALDRTQTLAVKLVAQFADGARHTFVVLGSIR